MKKVLLSFILFISIQGQSHSYPAQDALRIAATSFDGCTDMPSAFVYSGFVTACNVHDWQYTRVGSNRYEADKDLKQNWQRLCRSRYKVYNSKRYDCLAVAKISYKLVRNEGDKYFPGAQGYALALAENYLRANPTGSITQISTSTLTYYNPDQPLYAHLVDAKYVSEFSRNSYRFEFTAREKVTILLDAVSRASVTQEGDTSFAAWKNHWFPPMTQAEIDEAMAQLDILYPNGIPTP